jgi:hypothetical protein
LHAQAEVSAVDPAAQVDVAVACAWQVLHGVQTAPSP